MRNSQKGMNKIMYEEGLKLFWLDKNIFPVLRFDFLLQVGNQVLITLNNTMFYTIGS